MALTIEPTNIAGVHLIKPAVFGDDRGFFLESFRDSSYTELTGGLPFVQDNHSRSARNVLRGLHYQLRNPQGKLLYVVRGRILDVAVDIRKDSPTFGRHFACELSDENHHQVYIAPGLAHGFAVLSDETDVTYKCTDYYVGDDQYGIAWNDPELAIDWNVDSPILSERDQHWTTLKNTPAENLPVYEAKQKQ